MCVSGTQFSCRLVEVPTAVDDVETQLLNISILEAKGMVPVTKNSSTDNILYLVKQFFPVIGFADGKDFARAFLFDEASTASMMLNGPVQPGPYPYPQRPVIGPARIRTQTYVTIRRNAILWFKR